MRSSSLFSGLILPLLVIPWELLVYDYYRSIYAGAVVVTLGEVTATLLVSKLSYRELRLELNYGLLLVIPLLIIMTLYPSPSPIGYTYPFLLVPAVVGGICEELIYRGFIMEDGRYDPYVQSVLWSINHVLDGPVFVIYTFIIGVILGLISRRYGLLPCVIVHPVANMLRLLL
ncbi:CAAX amino terminal protease family [Metallosphaera yellowstonensis MK1]|jgi:membrane protease YdiL (CAAX protease family)|uniref:CAAX amino terminal protease family n=1 Tax=Metallosphaera yellowstonensis MK1 TaxID=671065 RepID=H2C1E2_9CREN|nr:CPBP family intramembrane glutamic endopeptidase [Metallosphaera yellowstonensis]EHP70063.1 CAAX amino terminal protease family [Metallosphaera yellowstonensis MK1]